MRSHEAPVTSSRDELLSRSFFRDTLFNQVSRRRHSVLNIQIAALAHKSLQECLAIPR